MLGKKIAGISMPLVEQWRRRNVFRNASECASGILLLVFSFVLMKMKLGYVVKKLQRENKTY